MKLSIIIPVHNEQATVLSVLNAVAKSNIGQWEKEIIVVNDGSTDASAKIISDWQKTATGIVVVLNHQTNLGKGAAIKSALVKTTGDYIIIQDADLEYYPADIFNLLNVVSKSGKTDVAVFGDRGIKRYPERGFHYVLGAKLLTWVFNIFFGQGLHDLYTCYKLFPNWVVDNIEGNGFEFEVEIAAKLLKKGVIIQETPIKYLPRSKSQGKHIGLKDAFIGLWTILKYRVK